MTSTEIRQTHGTREIDATGEIDATADVDELDETHARGWFEACPEHRAPDADGPCTRCGWLAADHTAGLAAVITVGRPAVAPLRRAS